MEDKPEEVLTRALLGMMAVEQLSLDRGSWLLAWEMQFMKTEPTIGQFSGHAAHQSRVPFTNLADPRWVEVVHARLKDMDDMHERRKKLDQSKPGRRRSTATSPPATEGSWPSQSRRRSAGLNSTPINSPLA
mmetsp:Transcript_35699/g.101589  ORF Transcript_35699/g.101589 Transcript_35699/m.101589 type:complete len:132 (-) Transcript_35699:412-807(-)